MDAHPPNALATHTQPHNRPVDLKPLITLLAIVNPLACVPFFIHFTQGFGPAQRRRTVWMASVTVFIVIAASALLGLQILSFFGISLASTPTRRAACCSWASWWATGS